MQISPPPQLTCVCAETTISVTFQFLKMTHRHEEPGALQGSDPQEGHGAALSLQAWTARGNPSGHCVSAFPHAQEHLYLFQLLHTAKKNTSSF